MSKKQSVLKSHLRSFPASIPFLVMLLPGTLYFLIMCYMPIGGLVLAFKNFRFSRGGFIESVINSPWVGFDNFKYLFATSDAWIIFRNTVGYNLVFIAIGAIVPVVVAIMVNELLNKKAAKIYQTFMFLPYFISWVVVSYFAFAFLSVDKGLLNSFLKGFGVDAVQWYSNPAPWPVIIVVANVWKGIGWGSVWMLAQLAGIDKTYYEAAMVDGANKWQQIVHVTLPHLKPLIALQVIMALGNIIKGDFGLFYQLPMNSGPLFPVTNILDTYIYRAYMSTGDVGMSTAAGLFQSVVGFLMILVANYIVRTKINKDLALY